MDAALTFLAALAPIAALLLALGWLRLPAPLVTPAVALGTMIVSLLVFHAGPAVVFSSALEGMALALWPIMLVVVAALFTYEVANATGYLRVIESFLTGITNDRRLQVLILAWGFGGFLEAVAGYGTAVAIPASILIVLGFDPVFASVICLVANTVPTAFGAVGIPVITLAQLTGLDARLLSAPIALQLTPFLILIPFFLVMLTGGGLKALRGVWTITLASGLSFAAVHLWAALALGPELPALLGSAVSLAITVWLAGRANPSPAPSLEVGRLLTAGLPYLLMFALILLTSPLVAPIHETLKTVSSSLSLTEGRPLKFYWIATPGVAILAAAFLGGRIQGASWKTLGVLLTKTVVKLGATFVTVMSILAMARVMGNTGMTTVLAQSLTTWAGGLYPALAPLLGALGTFVTGSDTSSNILFGQLQAEVAAKLGQSPFWLASANTAGATAGKMISPQSLAVAVSATGLSGQESSLLRGTLPVCLAYVLVLGLMVFSLPALGWV